jgi:HAD superfamily hydrolase (TIGR01509 family)
LITHNGWTPPITKEYLINTLRNEPLNHLAYQAVAWDMDGTLIDSEPLHQKALQEVCRKHGVSAQGLDDESFIGVHARDVWCTIADRFEDRLDMRQWLTEIEAYYIAESSALKANPQAVETVQRLSELGCKQACVSNSDKGIVQLNLEVLGIADLFEISISLDDVLQGKPDPEPYWAVCRGLDCRPETTIAVEDSPTGILSAKRAGLMVVAYSPNGNVPGDPDIAVTGLEQVLTIIRGGSLPSAKNGH